MRVAVLGAGSLGSLYAALLSRVDDVELLIHSQGNHGAHMTADGLHLEGLENQFVSNQDVFFSLEEVGLPDTGSAQLISLSLPVKPDRRPILQN